MALGTPARIGAWRRTLGVAAVVGGALTATALGSTGTSGASLATPAQAAAFNNGTGSAFAGSVRIDPVAGGLSFGIGVGESLAGHQNTVATAESRAASLGVIGVTLAAPGCDGGDPTLPKESQPQPVRTETGAEGSEAGFTSQDPIVPGVDRTVRANADPFAESVTTSQGLDIPGVLSIGPTVARATSGVFGDYREATATTDIASISLAGVINIEGLHWEAFHRSGSREEIGGSFSIGRMTGPLNLPIPTGDVLAALGQANTLLAPFGLRIEVPTYHLDTTSTSTLATVDAFAIALVPAPLRDQIIQPILSGLQVVRDPLFQALIDASCSVATPITILDIVLNATGPGGQLSIDLGGVQASSSAITRFTGLGDRPTLPPVDTPTPAATGGTGGGTATPSRPSAGGPSTPTGTGSAASSPSSPASPTDTPLDDAVAAAADGERGGKLLAVGAGGLLALLAAAEGDRRKMRQAQRMIPLEA